MLSKDHALCVEQSFVDMTRYPWRTKALKAFATLTLLDFAENHGLQAPFSRRSGQCGSCKVNVAAGSVVHTVDIGVELAANEALLCCALPAATEQDTTLVLLL